MATAPANALIVEVSPAETRMSSAEMPVATTPGALSPSIAACTSVLMRLSALTPEPAAPMPP